MVKGLELQRKHGGSGPRLLAIRLWRCGIVPSTDLADSEVNGDNRTGTLTDENLKHKKWAAGRRAGVLILRNANKLVHPIWKIYAGISLPCRHRQTKMKNTLPGLGVVVWDYLAAAQTMVLYDSNLIILCLWRETHF